MPQCLSSEQWVDSSPLEADRVCLVCWTSLWDLVGFFGYWLVGAEVWSLMGIDFQFYKMTRVLEMDGGDVKGTTD